MLILVRSNSINSDSRAEKYINFYKEFNINYEIIGWDRLGENLVQQNTIYYNFKSGYNIGGIKAAISRFRWMVFVLYMLIKSKNKPHLIHGCDLDGVFPAIIYKIFFNRKVKIIFDIFDWFSDTLYNQNLFIRSIFKLMERITISNTDEVIICEPERIKQIPFELNKKELILPNIPSFKNYDFLENKLDYHFNNNKVTISYVGGLYNERLLNELFSFAERGVFNLLLAGYGDKELEDKAKNLNKLTNVIYFGKVEYSQGLNIMYNSDLIFASYSKTNKNHIYAAPNKFYEAMLLGKPIITNDGTILSKKVLDKDIGYVLNEKEFDLEKLVLNIDTFKIKGNNAKKLWREQYQTYIHDFLTHEYLNVIS